MNSITGSIARLAFSAACVLPLSAFAQGKGETVRLQDYPGVGNMLVRVAISKGYCEKYGIKCALQMIPNGPLGAQAVLAKSIEGGLFGVEVMSAAAAKGASMKMVVGGAVTNVATLIVRTDAVGPNADKPFPAFMSDLKGKKISVPARGSAMEMTAVFMLRKAGMKEDDVTFVATGAPNTTYAALVSKQVDAAVTFEPAGTLCEVLKTCKVLYRASDSRLPAELYATNGAQNGLVFRDDYISQNPHVIEALTSAIKDAESFIQNPANFEEAVKIALGYFKFDLPNGDALMAATLKTSLPTYKASLSRPAAKAVVEFLLAVKLIDAPIDIERLIHAKAP